MRRAIALILALWLAGATAASAQPRFGSVTGPGPLQVSAARFQFPVEGATASLPPAAAAPPGRRSTSHAGPVLGLALAGMLMGGWMGAAIQGSCNCDDPGMKGGVLGIAIGGAGGAIMGWKLSR